MPLILAWISSATLDSTVKSSPEISMFTGAPEGGPIFCLEISTLAPAMA